jgi:fatty acid desaturase
MLVCAWFILAAVAMIAALVLVFRCDRMLDEIEMERRIDRRAFERQMRRLAEMEEEYEVMLR